MHGMEWNEIAWVHGMDWHEWNEPNGMNLMEWMNGMNGTNEWHELNDLNELAYWNQWNQGIKQTEMRWHDLTCNQMTIWNDTNMKEWWNESIKFFSKLFTLPQPLPWTTCFLARVFSGYFFAELLCSSMFLFSQLLQRTCNISQPLLCLHCCYHAFAFGNLKLQSHSRKVAPSADHYPARSGDNVFSHLQSGYSLINFPTVAATVVDLVRWNLPIGICP